MWVLTESGELVNLDLVEAIDLVGNARLLVEAYYPRDGGSRTLCTCDDEAQARRIIQALVTYMVQGAPVVGISEVKAEVERWLAKERGEA